MLLLTIYAAVLLVAGLFSRLSRKTVFSTAVLFLVTGLVIGPTVFHVVEVDPRQEGAARAIELALFAVLYVDGMHIDMKVLRAHHRLPARPKSRVQRDS